MDKPQTVTFQLSYRDFKTLVGMLETVKYRYNLGERNIYQNFTNILKKLENK